MSGRTSEITLTLTEFKFSPDTLNVKVGERIKVTFGNRQLPGCWLMSRAEPAAMSPINRFSSRRQRLDHAFLSARLRGAQSYKRIAGYYGLELLWRPPAEWFSALAR